MKKDRFARMTYKPESWHENQSMDDRETWAAKLLRRQHAAMVRLVEGDAGI